VGSVVIPPGIGLGRHQLAIDPASAEIGSNRLFHPPARLEAELNPDCPWLSRAVRYPTDQLPKSKCASRRFGVLNAGAAAPC
jgi:hypothetical protein